MIHKIKSFFKSESNNQFTNITITNENWKRNYSKFLENISDDTQANIIESINTQINTLKSYGDELLIENFSKDTNERMRKLIEEDREIYVRLLKNFCDNSTIKIESRTLYFEDLFKDFMLKLKTFTKDTENIYPQLKEHYPSNISKIMSLIKDIHANYKSLEESTKKGIMGDFEDLRNDTKNYFLSIEENKRYVDMITLARNEVEDITKKLKIIENKKETTKLLKEYQLIKESYEEREIIDSKISKNKEELCELIFSITDVLEEYKKRPNTNKNLVQKYLDDPVSAFLNDTNFELSKTLGDLKFDPNLKDPTHKKKQQRITATVDKIQKKTFITNWISTYNLLQKNKKAVDDKMKNNKIMMDLSELDYQISHLTDRINKKHALIKSCEESIEMLNLTAKKIALEEKIRKVFGKRVNVE